MMRTFTIVVACSLGLGGCGDEDDPPSAQASTGAAVGSTSSASPSTGPSTSGTAQTGSTAAGTTLDEADSTGPSGCVAAGGGPVLEDLTLAAADGTSIAATVARPAEGSCLPGVLLVHQYLNDRGQWTDVQTEFVAAGYVALAIDLRGHGDSDPQQGELSSLLNDPDQAPQDVAAGVQWLAADAGIDDQRLAVVGTSIGANLSVVALHQGGVAAAVAVSPRLDPVMALAGMPAMLSLDDLFCIAADNDGGGDQAASCTQMVAEATGEARLEIIEGSSAHGVAVFDQFPRTTAEIIGWLDDVL